MNYNRLLLGLIIFTFFLENRAAAYLDPGTGTYMFQVLMATFFGFIFVVGNSYRKIKDYLAQLINKIKRKQSGGV